VPTRKSILSLFVVAAAGQGERFRDPEDGSQHWVIVSSETCENHTAQAPDARLANDNGRPHPRQSGVPEG